MRAARPSWWSGLRRAKPTAQHPLALLEVSPRAAKVLIASGTQLQRLNAATLPEPSEDPSATLRALLDAQPLASRQVGVLVGREAFSLRTLELPSIDPKELASMLDLQLGKLTPYPRSEILFGWATVGSFREGYTTVLLAIAPKAMVEGLLQQLRARGITPSWVGLSTEGLELWAQRRPQPAKASPGALTALIDVDIASTDCAVFSSQGQLVFSHSIALGAEQLTASDQARLRWLGELVRLPRILLHEEIKGQLGRGLLTGSTQGVAELGDQLSSQWGVPVEAVDGLSPCAPSPSLRQAAAATRVSYTALVGVMLGARLPRIDLMPPEARVSQTLHLRATHLSRLAVNLVILLIGVLLLSGEWILILGHQRAQLEHRTAVVEQTARQVMDRKQRMQQIRAWMNPAHSALEVLQAVAAASDRGIAVLQFSYAEDEPIKIRGTAEATRAPYDFVDRLKEQPAFAGRATCVASVKGTGARGTEFEVVCRL